MELMTGPEIREPLRSRPVRGAFQGAVAAVLVGIIALAMGADGVPVLLGFALGGGVGGVIIGTALPLFRSRVLAGLVVAVAGSAGYGVATYMWGQRYLGVGFVLAVGGVMGFFYATLYWNYVPSRKP